MTAPINSSLASIRVGGREYPAVVNQRCATCCHPERACIERNLVRGWSPATIAASLPPDRTLTARQIGDHFRSHLAVRDEGVQRYRERAAEERGEVVAEAAEQVATALEFTRRIVRNVDARLARGDLVPSLADGLRAAQVLAPLEQDDRQPGGYSVEEVTGAFMGYLAAIRATCTPEQVRSISQHVNTDPVMQGLWARQDGAVDGASR